MPLVQIHYSTPRDATPDLRQKIARIVSRHAAGRLGKREDLTAVVVRPVESESWFVGGASVAGSGLAAYAVEITVTAGTNTKAEKAAFVAAVHRDLSALLGPVHTESYVHVEEAPADAYGYGGLTQEWRFVAGAIEAEERAALAGRAIALHGVR